MRPSQEALCHTPLLGPQGGRSRPHLSLREGSEKTHRRGADAPEKDSMRWQNPIPVSRALGRRPAGPMNWRNPIRVAAVLGGPVIRVAALVGWISWRMIRFLVGLPAPVILLLVGLGWSVWGFIYRPFPLLDLVAYHTPRFYLWMVWWYYLSPAVVVMLGGLILLAVWWVFFESRSRSLAPLGILPDWPLKPGDPGPGIVVGELHHPVAIRQISNPSWLTIPERGLYTGVAIFGAVGSGNTSACMHPFAQQLLGWQADKPHLRAAALVLEVKGDFCHDIRQILARAGREADYLELSMDGRWQWNPLSAWWLDSYSLAYTVSSLLNQLFGKGKEPFWQQAYTNLVRWIIELHRVLPERWVTLQQVYYCAIDPELFAEKIEYAEAWSAELNKGVVFVPDALFKAQMMTLAEWVWTDVPATNELQAAYSVPLRNKLDELSLTYRIVWEPGPGDDVRERVEAVKRWYTHDWQQLDKKIKSSIVEGVSVFLSMFDMPDVVRVFCPPPPKDHAPQAGAAKPDGKEGGKPTSVPSVEADRIKGPRHLPELDELIESGKVLALNMPAGANPALARAIGVMLKNAWLQALLRRPAKMKESPGSYFRPAVFICDEYQAFASVGEDDPSGDEKSFALTRQCRCIPIVATQSISSLRSVLGSSEAWRALLQTLRTRIFLSLSDDASAKIASELREQVTKIKGSYTISESSKHAEVSPLSGRAGGGGGSIGATKSFREQREAIFHPRDFALLSNCQAICLPYDGTQSLEACRVYLKPHYLPRERSYWRAREAGQI